MGDARRLVGQHHRRGGCVPLIGGFGSDRLVGNAAADILIAGTTDHDADEAALGAIMAEWAPCDASYGERIGHLEHGAGRNGAMVLNDTTVHDDGAEDQLTGSAGRDWFFANRNCGAKDIITDLQAKEGWVDID